MEKKLIKHKLDEAFNKDEKDQIKDEIVKILKSSDLKDIIHTLVNNEIKGNKELEKETVEITRNVITQLFKTLWVKRGVWQTMLKNKAS